MAGNGSRRLARAHGNLALAIVASILATTIAARARATEPDEAAAPEIRLPIGYTQRPLTLPRLVLEPIGAFDVTRNGSTLIDLTVAAAFGITDDFQVTAIIAPLQLSPVVTYGQWDQLGPALGVDYRLAHGAAEIGLHLDATAITLPGTKGAVVRPGLVGRVHAGRFVRLDFGMFVPITTSYTTTEGVDFPFALAVAPTEPLHIGLRSGPSIPNASAFPNMVLPFEVFSGFAIRSKDGPLLDLDPFVRWPAVGTDSTVQIGIAVRSYLYL